MIIHIGIVGISGRMGQALCELLSENKKLQLIGGLRKTNLDKDPKEEAPFLALAEKADIIIDFSTPESLKPLLQAAAKFKKPLIMGTTGYSEIQLEKIKKNAQKIPILISSNFSLGVALCKILSSFTASQKKNDFKIKITEIHHQHKKDKPSGTALMLKQAIWETSGKKPSITSYRKGSCIGKHKIIFSSKEERIEIIHEAFSRKVFAKGALLAVEYLFKQKPGLYQIEDLIKNNEKI